MQWQWLAQDACQSPGDLVGETRAWLPSVQQTHGAPAAAQLKARETEVWKNTPHSFARL